MTGIFLLNSVGLVYDGFGVAILGYAFFSKTVAVMVEESSTYHGANDYLLRSLIHSRTDGVTGTIFLVTGFLLQWLGSLGIRCILASQILLAVLAVALLSNFLFLRKFCIEKQVSVANDKLKDRK